MPSDTASTSSRLTIPISPTFSTDTVSSAPQSEATSDEQPDLGAFTTVLWAWNHLQPPPRVQIPQFHSPPSSRTSRIDESSVSSFTHPGLSEASGTESPPPPPETVWAQRQLQSYFNINSITPSSERVRELEDDEYEISVDNDNRGGGYSRDSPPPPSPLSDGSRTVEIYEAASDIEIQDTASCEDSLDQSTAGGEMAVPVTVLSPNKEPSVMLQGSDEGDNSSLTSRELPLPPLTNGDNHPYPAYSFHRSSSHQISALRTRSIASSEAIQIQITQRRADFPVHDRSSVYSQSTSRTAGIRDQHSPWSSSSHSQSQPARGVHSQNVPIDDSSSTYSNHTRDDSESAVRSLLHQARARSLVNDNSTSAHSSADDSDTSSVTREYTPGNDPSLMRTPESSIHILASHSYFSDSSQSGSLLSQLRSSSIPYTSVSNTHQRDRGLGRQQQRAPSFSPQVEPPSPLPTPEGSEAFPYFPAQRSLLVDGGDEEDDSHTPTHRFVRGRGQQDQESESARYLREGTSHPYPHPLKGHHVLPSTMSPTQWQPPHLPSERVDDSTRPATHHVDEEHWSGMSEGGLDLEQPSLGLLDEALGFIAAERAKWEAGRDGGLHPSDATFAPPEWLYVIESKRKRRRKKTPETAAKNDNSPSPSSSAICTTRPLLLAADADNEIHQHDHETNRPADVLMSTNLNDLDYNHNKLSAKPADNATSRKRITILSRPKPVVGGNTESGAEEPLVLKGKKGNRVGRKERERAKARRDRERAALQQDVEPREGNEDDGGEDDWDADDDDVDDEEGGVEGDIGFSSSSAAENVVASRVPAGSRAYIHQPLGKGPYKSTTANIELDGAAVVTKRLERDTEREQGGAISMVKAGRARKKPRPKRSKSLLHSKSYPNLLLETALDAKGIIIKPGLLNVSFDLEDDESEVTLLDQNKRSRLIGLAHKLQAFFPEQKKELTRVVQRLESFSGRKEPTVTSGSDKPNTSAKKRRGHVRNGGKGGSSSVTAPSVSMLGHDVSSVEDKDQDPAELVIKGPSPADDGPLIHIFIDHSNILIGLLNFLRRSPPPQSIISEYMTAHASPISPVMENGSALSKAISIPVSAKPKKSLTIPVIESPSESRNDYPIPLPSFATGKGNSKTTSQDIVLSKSLPTESVLDAHMAKRVVQKSIQGVISDGNEDREDAQDGSNTVSEKKSVRFPRHLWHAAFVLVLERGRAVSRRVVVTSSPLYQPMEKIKNLGYEVRVYIRVPDLGNGMDRERHKDRETKYAVTVATPRLTYGGKVAMGAAKKTHVRHLSGSTSAESGSAGSGRPEAATASNSIGSTSVTVTGPPGSANSSGTMPGPGRIRYREQGVDELLQLKLHQAIADADAVPKGSTIVLATGDGNVGQFNEDGFLGPVRTALKRGWKVELYAWEDGLSRSWRREFGENSEWGRKGLFRIVPLEKFATSLVEASGW